MSHLKTLQLDCTDVVLPMHSLGDFVISFVANSYFNSEDQASKICIMPDVEIESKGNRGSRVTCDGDIIGSGYLVS